MKPVERRRPPTHSGAGYTGRNSPTPNAESDPGPRSRVDEAYVRLKDMIIERSLSAGSAITEAKLTRDLSMSRTPVREALTRLAAEGYLRPAAGRGYIIAELTAEDLVNVYAVRAELEGLAAREAARRIRRVDLARLEDLYDDMAAALGEGRDEDLAALNSEFHSTIAMVSGNAYLRRMLNDIQNTFDLFRRRALTAPGRREDAHAEHGQLIEALRRNDSKLASRLAKLHVERALRTRQSTTSIEGGIAAEGDTPDADSSNEMSGGVDLPPQGPLAGRGPNGHGTASGNRAASTLGAAATGSEVIAPAATSPHAMTSAAAQARGAGTSSSPLTMRLLEQLDQLGASVSGESRTAARVLAKDFLGVAIAGSRTPEGKVIHRFAKGFHRPGSCHLVAHPELIDLATAALVTATSGYSIGLTDTHARSITHPGPSIVPVALAVGEMVRASGQEFLDALVVGCEAVIRVGAAVNPSHRARGFHPTATCNVFGAAVAAARLLGLDRNQTANAFGIAGSMASGIYEFRHEGSMLMALHAGWPAQSGVIAALLAQQGFTGPHTVLEGPEGFLRAFSDESQPELLEVDLRRPGILEVGLRPYNACRYGHSGVDALLAIVAKHGAIDPASVRRMTVATHRTAVAQETEPTTVIGARLSTKFTVAYAVAHGPKIDEVEPEDLEDPLVQQLIERTEVIEDPELTEIFPGKWACRVTVVLDDGSSYTERVDIPKGEPGNPMTGAEVASKFHALAEPVLGRAGADAAEAELDGVAGAPDLDLLARALSCA